MASTSLTLPTLPKVSASSSSQPSHHWYDGITGFIGHLETDVVKSVVGIPMGFVALLKDPIKVGGEIGQATWHDWSPLFHGDFRTWAHNTYEHPLAPLLDVLSVATLGAGSVARISGGLAKAGEIAATTDEAALAARSGKLATFANPGKAAYARHYADALKTGKTADQARIYARDQAAIDPTVQRIIKTPLGRQLTAGRYSNNPFIRARQKFVAGVGEKAAGSTLGKQLGADKVIGPAAMVKKLDRLSAGRQTVMAAATIQRNLKVAHELGKHLTNTSARELFTVIHPAIGKGIERSAAKVHLNDLNETQLAAEKQMFVRHTPDMRKINKALDNNDFEGALKAVTDAHLTDKLSEAVKVGKYEHVLVVPRKVGESIGGEAIQAARVLKKFYTAPTTVWKWLVLAMSPRYFVNNVVGNTMMLGMSANPVLLSTAIYRHIVSTRGQKAADEAARSVMSASRGAIHRAQRGATRTWLDDVTTEHQGWARSEFPKTRAEGIKTRVKAGFYPITHKFSDTIHRNAAANASIMRTPEYQAAYAAFKKQGRSSIEAHTRAAEEAIQSDAVRTYVRDQVSHTLGQYHTFTKWERAVKNVVPFYAWDRAIIRHTWELSKDKPYQAAMVSQISQRGVKDTQQMLGSIPDFLQGAIPAQAIGSGPLGLIAMLTGSAKHRKGIFETQGINPYSTIGDIVHSVQSVTGVGDGKLRAGESLGGMLNPLVSNAVEYMTGTSLVTGAPIKPGAGGLIGNIYTPLVTNSPQGLLLQRLYQKEFGQYSKSKDSKHPYLFKKDTRAALTSILGVPTRELATAKARQLANTQSGRSSSSNTVKPAAFTGLPGF